MIPASRTIALSLTVLVGISAQGRAQRVVGTLAAEHVTYRFHDAGGNDGRRTGTFLGGSVTIGLGRVSLGISGVMGHLPDSASTGVARDVRMSRIFLTVRATDWLEFGPEALARRAIQGPDTTLIRLLGAGGKVITGLGAPSLQGLAEFAYYPVTSTANTDQIKLALRAAIGVRFAPPASAFAAQATYQLFRVDYRSGGTPDPRLEQDAGLVLEISLRGGR